MYRIYICSIYIYIYIYTYIYIYIYNNQWGGNYPWPVVMETPYTGGHLDAVPKAAARRRRRPRNSVHVASRGGGLHGYGPGVLISAYLQLDYKTNYNTNLTIKFAILHNFLRLLDALPLLNMSSGSF